MSYDLSLSQVRGTASQLKATNATIQTGVICKETDTNKWKVGTGYDYNSTAYTVLSGEDERSADDVYSARIASNVGVYEAALTQEGTSDPVAVVFTNTTGRTVAWSRDGAGSYVGAWSSDIVAASSGHSIGAPSPADLQVAPAFIKVVMTNSAINIQTQTMAADGATDVTLTAADDCLQQNIIRIIIQ